MTIEVVRPGALSTLQDLGRTGFQHFGVPVGGAMDEQSHRIANLLVGNPQEEATLEVTLLGPSLRFTETALIAIVGADFSPRIGERALPRDTPVLVRAGALLEFARLVRGVRAYLAVRGGFAVDRVMNSKSTFVRGGFGGFQGRALRKGDALSIAPNGTSNIDPGLSARWHESSQGFVALEHPPRPQAAPPESSPQVVRVIAGQQWHAFASDAQKAFQESDFRLHPQSDRMGLRFEGHPLALREPLEMISEAVAFGTIQVPPDGNPIALMADRQTTGGYPKIASVASVDLPLLAQLMPGQAVRFAMISLQESQRLYLARERAIADFAAQVKALARS
jgi:antagonist of KipI